MPFMMPGCPEIQSTVVRPRAELAEFVEALWDLRVDGSALGSQLRIELMPTASPIVTFQYGDPLRRHDAHPSHGKGLGSGCAGFQNAPVQLVATGRAAWVTVRLKPFAAAQLLRTNMGKLTDQAVQLSAFWPSSVIGSLEAELSELATPGARIELVERFLLCRFGDARPDPLVARATDLMATDGARTAAALAGLTGFSERQLNRRCRVATGASPKRLARIMRLEKTVRAKLSGQSWADAAYDLGFADQAHLVRDFQDIVGDAPDRYLKSVRTPIPSAIDAALYMSAFLQ
jgi:AraC-like DNA-binding protein